MTHPNDHRIQSSPGPIDRIIRFCLENKLIVFLVVILIVGWGLMVAPFDWDLGGMPRDPVPVDAIPDIGENQQIVFTEWMGRSPQDVEDQVTYPMTVTLLGIPGVKTIRSYSMFGFASIYIIFEDGVDFYWSRSRVLEKLASLPAGMLPEGVKPRLGPDATALGQVFWYTLEGQDEAGHPTGGWDLDELRSIQDWLVRYALTAVSGVSEVASIGGYAKEYQIDVDPDAMRAAGVKLTDIVSAIKMSNRDVGARTIEVNRVEYVIRGIGFVKTLEDIENAVIKVNDNVPIYIRNVATVSFGPALRRGALDKEGAEAVGGVVVARYGENPLETINNVKEKIKEITPGLPRKTLPDGTLSQVKIVPFYDRSGLIYETLGTLNTALFHEILVTILVVLLMVMHLRSSILISILLPLAVLICFIAMKVFHVDANVVALSGIAIAIGTMVDMGIIITENILRKLDESGPGENRLEVIYEASREVGGAILTAVATTVISFLPVFTMVAAEGKLFRPLAFTKTFALLASVIVALTLIPPMAHILFRQKKDNSLKALFRKAIPVKLHKKLPWVTTGITVLVVAVLLTTHWVPLGPENGLLNNLLFVGLIIGGVLIGFRIFLHYYPRLLRWCLEHKALFLTGPGLLLIFGVMIWLGFESIFGWLPQPVKVWKPVSTVAHAFPGLGKEFMPPLDEGSYLFMPTTMPHASITEALDILQTQDKAIAAVPEVDEVVGKIGRVESSLDPAPVSMIETVINYKPKFLLDENGRRLTFRYQSSRNDLFRDPEGNPVPGPDYEPYTVKGRFEWDDDGLLIPDRRGKPFRVWRPALDPELNPGRSAWDGIQKPDDIWNAILKVAEVPGTTSAPKLQPISTRIVMLQSGMRAPMGVKVKGPDLESIERTGLAIERLLKELPAVDAAMVFADRIVGKPYLEIEIDRAAIARYGIKVQNVQDVIEIAIGGRRITTTVEGRERYGVRIRYKRELRDSFEALDKISVDAPDGASIPLTQLAEINYIRGPQMIKSEDTFLIGYVLFDGKPGSAEVDVVEQARDYLNQKIETGELEIPAGVSFSFAGSYENQVRAEKKLMIVLPLSLLLIVIILYLQFKSISTTVLVFSGIAVAWAGGFLLLWLYARPWFMDFSMFGLNMRDLFQVHTINLSVAVWVGFLALFGIATDDGVVIATYLNQNFALKKPGSIKEIRETAILAGCRRARPCLMTTATTILALIPILTATGRGADVMVPMAIPSFGGMSVVILSMFVVPVLYTMVKEIQFKQGLKESPSESV